MLKKLTLLAMAVGALIAFAAPSMASADFWYTGANKVGDATKKDTVHFAGTLSSTTAPLKISCDATANVNVWNTATTGTGEVESLTLTKHPTTNPACTVAVNAGGGNYVDVAGCEVNATSAGFPWHVDIQAGTVLDFTAANFTNEFNGCAAALGIPNGTKVEKSGTVTGQVVGNCVVFNNSGDIVGTTIDGELCSTEPLHLTAS